MTAVRKQIKLEEDEDAAQLKFPSEFKTADALLISEVHMLLKVSTHRKYTWPQQVPSIFFFFLGQNKI